MSDVVDNVKSAASATANMTRNQLDAIGDRLGDADVPGNARRIVGAIQENPIGLTLVALSIGFLLGSLLPVSDIERERLEPLGSKIADQAQATANDLIEAGKAIMAETAQTAMQTAATSVQSHGHDVVDAAKARAASS